MTVGFLYPDWPAPPGVRVASSLREGGVSESPWTSLNLGDHVGDDPACVAENRERLRQALELPEAPAWLDQVHGTRVLKLDGARLPVSRQADAATTARPGCVLAVLTADCLPVVLSRRDGQRVGVAHAGWRGLSAGVLEAAIGGMASPPGDLVAWLGPAIGQEAYEVGAEVLDALAGGPTDAGRRFRLGRPGHWHCDLAGLARDRLRAAGVTAVYGGDWCTASDPDRFFSHRRDGPCGRMATVAWIAPGPR